MQADEGASDAQVGSGYQIQVTECTHGTVTPSVEQAEQGDTVTLTVKPWGGYSLKLLKAVYTQDGAEKEITISEDNTFTMPDAEVTVTAGFEQTAWLTSIEFGIDKDGTNPVSVKLQPGVTDYEVRTNSWDYDDTSFYWKLVLNQEYDGVLIKFPISDYQDNVYKAKLQNEWESLSSWGGKNPRNFNIKFTPENTSITDEFDNIHAVEYNFALYRKASVKTLKLEGVKRKDFQRDKFEYTAIVDADKKEYEIKAIGYDSTYDISAGDITVKSAKAINLPLNWDTDGKMDVDITVSGEGLISTVYKLHLIKERIEDTPFIKEQPVGGQKYAGAVKAEDTTALSTVASANGTLSYQWYRNTANSYEGSQAIAGATESSYHPEFDGTENGTFYYFCVVTNTNESGSFTTNTDLVSVMVFVDPTPKNVKITYADGSELPAEGLYYDVRDEVKLGAQYEVDELLKDDVTIRYCYVDDQGRTYLISYTDAWNLYNKHGYLYCTATVKINGKSYTGYSKTDEDPGIEFTVCTTEAITQSNKATISAQGTDMEYVAEKTCCRWL